MCYISKNISKNQLELIKPLWIKLNKIHLNDSKDFKDHYKNNTFEKRIQVFEDIDEEDIFVEIVEKDSLPIAYCISTKKNEIGELDSLFVEKEHRESGLGKKLVENSVTWLKNKNCKEIKLAVAAGHEHVFAFYEKFGFKPKVIYLQMK